MKIKVNDEEVFELNEVKQKVIKNEINADEFEDDIKRRVRYIVEHKYEKCLQRLKDEWIPKLKAKGHQSIPLDDDEFCSLVFSDTEYKDKKQKVSGV